MSGGPLVKLSTVQLHEAPTIHTPEPLRQDMPFFSEPEAAITHMTPSLTGPERAEEMALPETRREASAASLPALQVQSTFVHKNITCIKNVLWMIYLLTSHVAIT